MKGIEILANSKLGTTETWVEIPRSHFSRWCFSMLLFPNQLHWFLLKNKCSEFSSVTQSCPTLCDPKNCSTPGLPVHHQLPEFTQTHIHRVTDAVQPSHPLSSLLLLTPSPPSLRVFSNESTLHMRWSKYWSFSFSISLLQHHSSKASILRRSAFFTVQLSHTYTTTGKTIPLTRWTLYCQRNVSAFEYAI